VEVADGGQTRFLGGGHVGSVEVRRVESKAIRGSK
jgi:hypothetical protein